MTSGVFIYKFAENKGNLILEKHISKDHIIIVDFYNVYCSLVKFSKYKKFSKDTVKLCIKKIIDTFDKNQQIIIISKTIFEFPTNEIITITKEYDNLQFIVVNDNHSVRGLNKERDDYICLLVQYLFDKDKKENVIISNDTFSNFAKILSTIKPITLNMYKSGLENQIYKLPLHSINFKLENVKRIPFYFLKSKTYK